MIKLQILLVFCTLGDGEGAVTCWPSLLDVVTSTEPYLHSATAFARSRTLTQRDTCQCWPMVPQQRSYDVPMPPMCRSSLTPCFEDRGTAARDLAVRAT